MERTSARSMAPGKSGSACPGAASSRARAAVYSDRSRRFADSAGSPAARFRWDRRPRNETSSPASGPSPRIPCPAGRGLVKRLVPDAQVRRILDESVFLCRRLARRRDQGFVRGSTVLKRGRSAPTTWSRSPIPGIPGPRKGTRSSGSSTPTLLAPTELGHGLGHGHDHRSMSDKDPSQWLPTAASAQCTYGPDWTAINLGWELTAEGKEPHHPQTGLGARQSGRGPIRRDPGRRRAGSRDGDHHAGKGARFRHRTGSRHRDRLLAIAMHRPGHATAPDNVFTLSDAFVLGRDGCQPLKSADLPQPKVDGASDAFDNDHRRAVSITCLVQPSHQPLPPAGYGASRTPRTTYDAR